VIWPILILAFANVCSFADRQLPAILAEPIRHSLRLDHTSMALLGGLSFALCYGFAGLPAGLAADRFPRRPLIFGAVIFWSLCTACSGLAHNFTQLFLARMGVGIGEAILLPCAFSIIRDLTLHDRRARGFFIFNIGVPIGMSAGLIIGGVVHTSLQANPQLLGFLGPLAAWQKTFVIMAVMGVPAALLALLLPEPARRGEDVGVFQEETANNLAPAMLFFVGVAVVGMVVQGAGFWTPSLFIERLHLTTGEVGLRMGLINIVASLLGVFVLSNIADWASARRGTRGVAEVFSGALLLYVPGALLLGFASGWPSWFGLSMINFTSIGLTTVMSALALRLGRSHQAGLMGALMGLVVNVMGWGAGPALYGWLKDQNLGSMGSIIALVTVALALTGSAALFLAVRIFRGRSARAAA
jgi:MFS family permease